LQGVSMAFRMVQLPESFVWPGEHANEALRALLDSLFPRQDRESCPDPHNRYTGTG
jgi:hypothetical protein